MAKEAEELAAQAERITQLRDEKGHREGRRIPQPEVADAVGISLRGYQDWEAGRADPELANLKALADYHGVSTDYIEYGVDRREQQSTPDLGARDTQIEERLSELAETLRVFQLETAAHDLEVLRLLEEVLRATRRSQGEQPQ